MARHGIGATVPCVAVAVVLAACNPRDVQRPTDPDASPAVLAAARDVIQRARYATLITNGADGQPQARIVDPLEPDSGFTVWVGTNPLSRKVADIRRNDRVTLMYFDAGANEYVAVAGRATIVSDSVGKAGHWKPEWAPFYRGGAGSPEFVLIRIRGFSLEVVSPRHRLLNDSLTWRPVTARIP